MRDRVTQLAGTITRVSPDKVLMPPAGCRPGSGYGVRAATPPHRLPRNRGVHRGAPAPNGHAAPRLMVRAAAPGGVSSGGRDELGELRREVTGAASHKRAMLTGASVFAAGEARRWALFRPIRGRRDANDCKAAPVSRAPERRRASSTPAHSACWCPGGRDKTGTVDGAAHATAGCTRPERPPYRRLQATPASR